MEGEAVEWEDNTAKKVEQEGGSLGSSIWENNEAEGDSHFTSISAANLPGSGQGKGAKEPGDAGAIVTV